MDTKINDAVVTLMTPKLEADNLTFDVAILEGSLTGASGPAALFIDRGGFGGLVALAAAALVEAVALVVGSAVAVLVEAVAASAAAI